MGKRRSGRPLTSWANDLVNLLEEVWLMQFIRMLTEKNGVLWWRTLACHSSALSAN